ncbi:MAG: hypothetical protein H6606_10620 [Flavobacteriales bacterium]|nr:hypothetical protein [Flavobacteriales bacterium]
MFKYLSLFFSGIPFLLSAQIYERTGTLDARIGESSGLEQISADRFLTLNDGGNEPLLFTIDSSGEVLAVLTLRGFPNNDWESVCSDADGGIYIGDFGNNNNDRRDLRIGYLRADQVKQDTATPASIQFTYADQRAFPPSATQRQYDCEAMIHFGDSLYLITKNRTNPYDGICRMYVLPDEPGTHIAVVVDSFYMDKPALLGQVTGAALHGNKLILLGYAHIWISSFSKVPRFDQVQELELGSLAQREGICVTSAGDIYFTEERVSSDAGIYRLPDQVAVSVEEQSSNLQVKMQDGHLTLEDPGNKMERVALFTANGQELLDQPVFGSEQVVLGPQAWGKSGSDLPPLMFLSIYYSSGYVLHRKIGWND